MHRVVSDNKGKPRWDATVAHEGVYVNLAQGGSTQRIVLDRAQARRVAEYILEVTPLGADEVLAALDAAEYTYKLYDLAETNKVLLDEHVDLQAAWLRNLKRLNGSKFSELLAAR